MEAQPLETIPEETAAKAPDRVTSDVPKMKPATAKNPGRVASGKRPAERNRLTREAKNKPKHKSLQAQQTQTQTQTQTQQVQVQIQRGNPAATRATLFWGLVVRLSPLWVCITNVKLS